MDWKIVKQLAAYEKAGEKAGLLEELVDNFFKEFPEQLIIIKQMIEQGKTEMLIMVAHKLKGGSYTIGARELGDRFKQLEDKTRKNDLNNLKPLLKKIDELAVGSEKQFRDFIAEQRSS